MRIFGSENISKFMDRLGMEEDDPIEHSMITRSIEKAQKKVEAHNFEIRKYVLEYDDVMNQQREVLYAQRRKVLTTESLRETVLSMLLFWTVCQRMPMKNYILKNGISAVSFLKWSNISCLREP